MPFVDDFAPVIAFIMGLVFIPLLLVVTSGLGLFTVVKEREAQVYTLFGKVLGTLDEAGLHFPVLHFGPRALLVPFFGKRDLVSTSLRQYYLRDQMVNSEEGTPMGVGIWYEMQVSDPVAYLFRNANPEGSLQANVASSTISTLSNLEMDKMLEDRHQLSHQVRATVSPLSEKWGYQLGSVYIRKVAFTDRQMVDNITEKVVKRLVQVTSAMKQDGENRVGLIKSQTAFKVSQTMAEASATRPAVVGDALNAIAQRDPEVLNAVLEVMENEQLIASGAEVDVLPRGLPVLLQLGAEAVPDAAAPATPRLPVDLSRIASFGT
ncbi:SPFH domain-containing protein [Lamprocystis purpurea]|jgi:regulator of protease activity HflC (stomatin/prohibitin superfamily)|uniref:SPFH domain-containing protein n=1 Tax=Lamprocystis purpurea TaxID=61598 RepID=UPI0003669C93|nr:SPFH domain-containing protein [Lamprocystis purpurea]